MRGAMPRSPSAWFLTILVHPGARHRLPPHHQSFLRRRWPEPRLPGAEQRGKMAVPPPGDVTGEKKQSPGRRSGASALCQPEWRRCGEMQMPPAPAAASAPGSPCFDQSPPGSRAGTSHLLHGWFACAGMAEPPPTGAAMHDCGRTARYNRANPLLQRPQWLPTPRPPRMPAPCRKPRWGLPLAEPSRSSSWHSCWIWTCCI